MSFFRRDLSLFVLLLLLFAAGRLALILLFGAHYEWHLTPRWIFTCFEFDAQSAAWGALPSILCSLAMLAFGYRRWLRRLQQTLATCSLTVALALILANVGFFLQYKCQFNELVAELFYDDTLAILKVAWDEYPILPGLLVIALFAFGAWRLMGWIDRHSMPELRGWQRFGAGAALIVLFFAGDRGFERSPLRETHRACTAFGFLNDLASPPPRCLVRALGQSMKAGYTLKDLGVQESDIAAFARRQWGEGSDLSRLLRREARGAALDKKPPHIFFILGESLSAYPLWNPDYSWMLPRTKALMPHSLATAHCIPASKGTIHTLAGILAGMPHGGVHLPHVTRTLPKDYALMAQLKALGYRSSFYYAGPVTWQDMAPFLRWCEFDDILCGLEIESKQSTYVYWGNPRDDELFEAVAARVRAAKEPGVHFILTLANHPPWKLDVEGFGAPADAPHYERLLGFAWLADKWLGEFVEQMQKEFPDALFVITGDHPCRNTAADHSFERFTYVPLLILGNDIEARGLNRSLAVATHLDIAPTLIELIAPAGFIYHTWGRNLLGEEENPRRVMPTAIFSNGKLYNPGENTLPGDERKQTAELSALVRWVIFKGNPLPHLRHREK